jgi:hypothetical protein
VEYSSYDADAKLDELRAVDPRARLTKSSVYKNLTIPIRNESWVLFLGPFETRADAQAACPAFTKVLPGPSPCTAAQLDP